MCINFQYVQSTNQKLELEGGIKTFNLLTVLILHNAIVGVEKGQYKLNSKLCARACCWSRNTILKF